MELHNYSLEFFKNILFNHFHNEVSEPILSKISEIALEVGSPQYIKTPIFKKEKAKEDTYHAKRKRPKQNETLDSEWNEIKANNQQSMLVTNSNTDVIISLLNKLTKNNYETSLEKIDNVVKNIIEKDNMEEIEKISNFIFDIASTNIFYSQIYAKLYTVLINNYSIIRETFEKKFSKFIDLFNNIEYVDPNVDYDKFCEITKDNLRRRSLSTFFVNLMDNQSITRNKIMDILKTLVFNMQKLIVEENNKYVVDELLENIVILCRKDMFTNVEQYAELGGLTILDFIRKISKSKIVDYKSLTNKAIFRCMDIMEA